jgi:molybdopterin molybdotransferase
VSSYVTAFLFLLPLLRRLGGARRLPRPCRANATDLPPGEPTEFVRARSGRRGDPANEQDSSALRALQAQTR